VKRFYSENTKEANKILKEILKKKNLKNIDIPIQSVLKFVSFVLSELMKVKKAGRIPLSVSLYD
jgi:hypothetical protein